MKAYSQNRSFVVGARALRVCLIALLLLLPAILSAQDVPYVTNGPVSLVGGTTIYNGQYVIIPTDFGFFWLDTATLAPGHVQALSKCGPWPPSDSNLYTTSDCNGITNVSSSGSLVVARVLIGGCAGSEIRGCGGPRDPGHSYIMFSVPGFAYLPTEEHDIPDSTQTRDPQGRTWTMTQTDPRNFTFHASGNPNAPPNASASATNQSAAGRSDKSNYFGDSWTLQDTSSSIAPILLNGIQWDFNYLGANFTVDRTANAGDTVNPAYFPCDPSAGGNIGTGANCWSSVGSPQSGSYTFALKADNGKPGSPIQFTSSSISVAAPQIVINGFDGTTLRVLTGGSADATASKGNTSQATFAWTFNPGGQSPTGLSVAVPNGTTSFSLTATYPAGYATTASGAVTTTDLVPAFSLSPQTVLINTPLTLTNQMQIGGGTTLTSVSYTIKQGPTVISSGTLAASFLAQSGTAQVTAPANPGSYTMDLVYTFNGPHGSGQTASPQTALFAATNWAPNPLISISPLSVCGSALCLTTGTQYSLSDLENILVSPHPGAQWDLINSSTQAVISTIGFSADANVAVSWTPSSTCTSNCAVRVIVSGVSAAIAATISNPGGGGPTPPSVSVSGPTSVNVGQNATYSANVANATGTVSYAWNFGDSVGAQTGTASMTHAWSNNGTFTVSVAITASNGTAAGSQQVTVVGKPAPLGTFTVTPSQKAGSTYTVGRGVEVTFTADETSATQWGWDFGDGTLAGGAGSRTVKKTYGTNGSYSGSLLVYGDGTVKSTGPTVASFTIVVAIPAPSAAFTVQNATQNSITGNYDAYAGATLTFTAAETKAVNWGWDFGDGSPVAGKTVTHVFPSIGSYNAHLLVYGDGVNTSAGPSAGNFTVNVTKSPFQASIVPGAAHLDDGTNTWGTDLSVSNAGTSPVTINLAFLPLLSDAFAPQTQDLSQLNYGAPLTLSPGGAWSVTDVVSYLNGGNSKGTVVIKYSGGSAPPLVSARVYFQPKSNPRNISYGSGIPSYIVDGSGQIYAQGVGPSAVSSAPTGLAREAIEALEGTITVNKTGTGTGTVTSDPAGINCGATCSGPFNASSSSPVTLTASADSGSAFVSWTGCDLLLYGNCIVTSSSATITAKFDATAPPSNNTLSVTKAGTGSGTVTSSPAGINCGSTCSASFDPATNVTLTASAASGSTFSGWSGGGCSGTGTCSVTMATAQSITATFAGSGGGNPPPSSSSDQVLIGLRSDPRYRFGVTLFNASGATGNFRIAAMDEESTPLLISDGADSLVAYRDFAIRPFQQIYLTNDDLKLNDPGRRYVLKGTRNSSTGTLLAFGTALDRVTRDLVQITDDSQVSPAEAGLVNYWVAGVSRYDSSYGAHWRTDLRIYNRGSHTRNLYFEYSFSGDGVTEHVARVDQVRILAGELLTYDDVVLSLLSKDTSVNLSGSSAGILRIYSPEDSESSSRPLIIGSRNYDDQPTGTAGSQLAVYTRAHGAGAGKKLYLAGAEESERYASRIGVFAMDPGPVLGVISAVAPDGTVVGSVGFSLGGSSPHFGQLSLTDPNMNFNNPGKPVTIRIDQLSGGRVGAYVFTVDKVTLDTNFIQALPQ